MTIGAASCALPSMSYEPTDREKKMMLGILRAYVGVLRLAPGKNDDRLELARDFVSAHLEGLDPSEADRLLELYETKS